MLRARILHPTVVRLALRPGDEIHQADWTPELRALLQATRADGALVAAIVDEDEHATLVPEERAVVRPRRARVGA